MRLKSVLIGIVLLLSLILNGAAAGYFYSQWPKIKEVLATKTQATPDNTQKAPNQQQATTTQQPFLGSVPEDKRQEYFNIRKENNESLQEHFKQIIKLRGDLLNLLAADDFSETAYKAKLEEMIKVENEIQRKRIEPTLMLAKTLSKDERKALVEQLKLPATPQVQTAPAPKQP